MPSTKYYPKLSSVMNTNALPEALNFVEGGIENLLDDIYLKDLQYIKSASGGNISYYTILKIFKAISLDLLGTGFEILLNPPPPNDPYAGSTEIPISINLDIKILEFVQDFSLQTFSEQPDAFFNLLIDLLGLDETELLDNLISLFTSLDQVNELIDLINELYNLSGTTDEIPYPTSTDRLEAIEELITFLENANLDVLSVVYAILDNNNSKDVTLDNIQQLFSFWLGQSPIDLLKDLFLPQLEVNVGLNPALEIPRSVLLPIKPDGTLETNTDIKTRLNFAPSNFTFSTKGGIGFDTEVSVSFDPAYPTAQIGKTGITIGFTKAYLDLSQKTNIPQADAASYPTDFIGVFIEQATIGLPPFWTKTPNQSIDITGKNLLIGTGGFSGTIGLDGDSSGVGHLPGRLSSKCPTPKRHL